MIPVTTFAGQRVAVFGLGKSGMGTVRALIAGGADVLAWDDTPSARASALAADLPVIDLKDADWSAVAALVLAPGVPLTHPEPHWTVAKARAAGVEVIGDVELFMRERAAIAPGSAVIAVTGTNGKSTTTALIAHVLAAAGQDVSMGGNIGVAVLDLAPFASGRVHVLELSSFQIDLTPSLSATVGVHLNITPDHLDRHGPENDKALALRNYGALKERLVSGSEIAVIGIDDPMSASIYARRVARGLKTNSISASGAADFAFSRGMIARDGRQMADLTTIPTLRGAHNGQNASAAMAVAISCGVRPEVAATAFALFAGLPHRMEEVGRLTKPDGEVLFINDSKATNADSTEKALASFAGDIYWILGGTAKDGGIESLRSYFPRIARAYLIGAATPLFAATLAGKVEAIEVGTLAHALELATRDARQSRAREAVVLLSPACASYDQFKNFEDRGDQFRAAVVALDGVIRAGPSPKGARA